MNTQVYTNKTRSFIQNLNIQPKLLSILPLPLYRTHKHICERCNKRCHIIYEIGKTDCVCEQYKLKK